MNLFLILFLIIICIGLYIFADVQTKRAAIVAAASRLIADAEKLADLTGPEKMEYVVKCVAAYVPTLYANIFTPETLQRISQLVYDNMRDFAATRLKL